MGFFSTLLEENMSFCRTLSLTIFTILLLGLLWSVALGGCGDDDDDDEPPPNSCEYESCQVTCVYEPVPGEDYPTEEIIHAIGDGLVSSNRDNCNNEDLYKSFENVGAWQGDIFQACETLTGYMDPDESDILFECEDTTFHE